MTILRTTRYLAVVTTFVITLGGCQSKFERLPQATDAEKQAMTTRYKELISEAKGLAGGGDSLELLHHFSPAILSQISIDDFKAQAEKFVSAAAAGSWDKMEVSGARSPGKVRLLLVNALDSKGAVPFVQSSDGWKLDDIAIAFGVFDQEINLKGNVPASPPSPIAGIAVLQDPQSSDFDRVQSALNLADAKAGKIALKFAKIEKKPWARAALHYAAHVGGEPCETFANEFPTALEQQRELHDSDTNAYRTLLHGFFACAATSESPAPARRLYQAGLQVASYGEARSEYVDPLVGNPEAEDEHVKLGLANAQPEYILKAALASKLPYEKDTMANIIIGGLHGVKSSNFYKYLYPKAETGGSLGSLAKIWVEKMEARDQLEPPTEE